MNFGTSNAFSDEIENIVWMKDCTYMEAVLMYCENRGIEEDLAGAMVKKDPVLTAKIQAEAENLNYLPRHAKLPL